jgi:hypothetical protein
MIRSLNISEFSAATDALRQSRFPAGCRHGVDDGLGRDLPDLPAITGVEA